MNVSVFFFKQKTAYEMRISDWSSDVCSSDLLDRGVPLVAVLLEFLDADLHQLGKLRKLGVAQVGEQIGRASCRERVCQYGVDLGGRRIIKKNNTTEQKTCRTIHHTPDQHRT